jgi:chemotaxis protein CheX
VDVKYVNPFIESFKTVMPQLGFNDIRKGDLSVNGQELNKTGVIVLVGIVGAIKGNVVYCLDLEHAKQIASTMMMGMPVEEFDEMPQSALSEMMNMLTASAATCFYELGIHIDISTPTLLHGKNIAVKMSSAQVLCVQMMADAYPIEINIAFE